MAMNGIAVAVIIGAIFGLGSIKWRQPQPLEAPAIREDIQDADLKNIPGTITYLDLEGGVHVIKTTQGTYNPINLDPALKQNGLEVTFSANFTQGMLSFQMVGRMIKLLDIQPR